jgi:hypothetical protein
VCTSVIPTLESWRQEAPEFKASLDYKARPCLKKKEKETRKKFIKSLRYKTMYKIRLPT